MTRQYYYAVNRGYRPGVYLSWAECHKNIDGYPGNSHKKFDTLKEAEEFAGVRFVRNNEINPDNERSKATKVGDDLSDFFKNLNLNKMESTENLEEFFFPKDSIVDKEKERIKVVEINDIEDILEVQMEKCKDLKKKNRRIIIDTMAFLKELADNDWHTRTGVHVSKDNVIKVMERLLYLTQAL